MIYHRNVKIYDKYKINKKYQEFPFWYIGFPQSINFKVVFL